MNLFKVASGVIGAVNPPLRCLVQVSTGYTAGPDFSQIPAYQTFYDIPCQVQSLTSQDLRQVAGLNLQGTLRAIYVEGNVEGIDRRAIKGGDLFTLPNMPSFPGPTTWLVAQVLEHWDGGRGWTKVAAVLQNP